MDLFSGASAQATGFPALSFCILFPSFTSSEEQKIRLNDTVYTIEQSIAVHSFGSQKVRMVKLCVQRAATYCT